MSLSQLTKELQNKQVLVLGLGLTGMSFVRFLRDNNIAFSANDSRESAVNVDEFAQAYPNSTLVLGKWDTELIASADVLLVSPGIDLNLPDLAQAIANNSSPELQVWGDIELYFRCVNTPCVAVTGSNGKSTVVSLLHHIGEQLNKNVQLGGNVGVPVLDTLAAGRATPELLILELSSFQLETLTSMNAEVATVLNVSDDHLDRHKTMANYAQIKQRIYAQSKVALFNRDDQQSKPFAQHSNTISFGEDQAQANDFGLITIDGKLWLAKGDTQLIALSELPIAGVHNALNCLACLAMGEQLGWAMADMLKALTSFNGLAHRCQKVPTKDGVNWINDSKATNVGATLAAINGLASELHNAKTNKSKKLVLIAGGESKGADLSPLATPFSHVSKLITIGKDAELLMALHDNAQKVESIEQAVAVAKASANAGDIVLLSPACASLDMFKNFAERGDRFMQAVSKVELEVASGN